VTIGAARDRRLVDAADVALPRAVTGRILRSSVKIAAERCSTFSIPAKPSGEARAWLALSDAA
jgi:hypothetical protein